MRTSEKHGYYHRQVEVLHDAYNGTHELMNCGKASYLEVLTAQETLLSAQLNEATNMYDAARAGERVDICCLSNFFCIFAP